MERGDTEVDEVRRCGAMQCYGMMVEGMGDKFQPFVAGVMGRVKEVIGEEERRQGKAGQAHRLLVQVKDEEGEEEKEEKMEEVGEEEGAGEAGDWRLLYFTLITLEKAIKSTLVSHFLPHLSPSSSTSLFPSLVSFLLHPHTWIRSVSTRLFTALLSTSPTLTPDQTLRLLKVTCMQLNSTHLTPKLADIIINNLLSLSTLTLTLTWPPHNEDKQPSTLSSLVDQSLKNRGLNWTFHRLSYLSRQPGLVRRRAVLRFYREVMRMEVGVWVVYLAPLLHSLFRMANVGEGVEDGGVKDEAGELMEEVQRRVEGGVFLAHYNAVRSGVMDVRRERKDKRKTMAVTNPAVFAKRKIDKHERKKVSRKRKMEGVKLAKGIAGVTRIDRPRMEDGGGQRKRQKSG
jgi:U3 small nucleolar RNA-associated protein 20